MDSTDGGDQAPQINGSITTSNHDVESDPELQAELAYAREQGGVGDLAALHLKAKLRKSKSMEAENIGGVQQNGVISVPRTQKNQRKSRTGRGRGLPKKCGGGKGTWGAAGKLYEEAEFLDDQDPNYDSDVQGSVKYQTVAPELSEGEFHKTLQPILKEYFENGDTEDAADSVDELSVGRPLRPNIVRLLVIIATEHKPSHRELASLLIAELVGKRVLTVSDVIKAFRTLLKTDLPDLVIDNPSVPEMIGNFIARTIADEALPSEFLNEFDHAAGDAAETDKLNAHAAAAVERAKLMLCQKHRLDNVWGVGGGMRPVRYLVKKIKLLLDEYLSSGDVKEAIRCLQELEVPHFNHELVFQAGLTVIEAMHERPTRLLAELLSTMYQTGVLTQNAVADGFERLYYAMPDLCLDVPPAYTLLERWVSMCFNAGILSADIMRKMPQRGRKRFVSEGDGGRLKVMDLLDVHPLI